MLNKLLKRFFIFVGEILFFVMVFVLSGYISTIVVKPILRLMNPDWSPELLAKYSADGPGAAMIGGVIIMFAIAFFYYCRKLVLNKLLLQRGKK